MLLFSLLEFELFLNNIGEKKQMLAVFCSDEILFKIALLKAIYTIIAMAIK